MTDLDKLYYELNQLNKALETILNRNYKDVDAIKDFLYLLEWKRTEIYDQIKIYNETTDNKKIHTINKDYNASIMNDMLYIHIPEKLPTLKNISSYTHKQIILNVSEVTSKYKGLFYDEYVIIIIKIYDKEKVWDTDNRTVKPIQDGLVNAGVIKDDNFKNSCYMVQGFYSTEPYIDVFVLKAKNILEFINKKLPTSSQLKWQNF